jgi:formylglycine-generating enzyme required for sulfatase activity
MFCVCVTGQKSPALQAEGAAIVKRKSITQTLCLAMASCVGMVGASAAPVTIETVPVGDAGNVADNATGNLYGSVGYGYDIGKYEVTAGQYREFLNAVAKTDTYRLYNTSMSGTMSGSGITRSGASGSYSYAVNANFVNRPVNYVSFGDAMRFANWMHNGQPTGDQNLSTTEDGAYFVNGANANSTLLAVSRKSAWKWAVTSENEWYKAAYYTGTGAEYFMYPTSNNTAPGRDMTETTSAGNNANYYTGSGPYPIDSGLYYTTQAGEFELSDSPCNTFDQGGNVYEWNEAIIGSDRGRRGGSFQPSYSNLRADFRSSYAPTGEDFYLGFRLSEIPEPASAILAAGVLPMLRRRR